MLTCRSVVSVIPVNVKHVVQNLLICLIEKSVKYTNFFSTCEYQCREREMLKKIA